MGFCVIIFSSRVVKEDIEDAISFKLLGKKVPFGHDEFDMVIGLRYRLKCVVEFE